MSPLLPIDLDMTWIIAWTLTEKHCQLKDSHSFLFIEKWPHSRKARYYDPVYTKIPQILSEKNLVWKSFNWINGEILCFHNCLRDSEWKDSKLKWTILKQSHFKFKEDLSEFLKLFQWFFLSAKNIVKYFKNMTKNSTQL